MKNKSKYTLLMISLALIIGVSLLPGFPWSTNVFFNLRRVAAKTQAKLSKWKGQQTQIISITGKLKGNGAMTEALKGAQVIAIESTSGYAALSDQEGKFVVPHLVWYPGAQYNLVISANIFHTRLIKVTSPQDLSAPLIVDLGDLEFDLANEAEKSELFFRTMPYDFLNHNYYQDLFDKLTINANSDEEKISRINSYIATKLNYDEHAKSFPSPRAIIERGSCYCSNLAIAMTAVTTAGNYPTRTVHLTDSTGYLNTHVVVEVFYQERWHLYDPTYGVSFLNKEGIVANYRELRLDTSLIKPEVFQNFDTKLAQDILKWMPGTFNSGFHQIYSVKRKHQ